MRATKRYTAATIDWLAVWDATTDRCLYVAADMLGDGRAALHLRYTAPRNNQRRRIHWADDHRDLATAAASCGLHLPLSGP